MPQDKVKLQFLHPSGNIVTHEFDPTDSLADVHASLTPSYAHPDNSPIFSRSPQPTAAGALENTSEFQKQARDSWAEVEAGKAKEETGFPVSNGGKMGPITRTQDQETKGRIDLRVPPNTFAVVHTHGDSKQPDPSAQDIRSAQEWGHPVYVVGRAGLFEVAPDGTVNHVFKDPSWMKERQVGPHIVDKKLWKAYQKKLALQKAQQK